MSSCRLTVAFLFSLSLILILAGCGGGGANGGGGGTGPAPGAAKVYVLALNFGPLPPSIVEFPETADGNTSPTSTVTGPSNFSFGGLAIDSAGNQYVGSELDNTNQSVGTSEILVYAPGANGTATPARTIGGAATGLNLDTNNPIFSIAVDGAGNIYVASAFSVSKGVAFAGISVFSSTANGNVAPIRVIGGPATDSNFLSQIAVDAARNIYVANSPPFDLASIQIFDANSTGNVPPTGTLAGSETTLTTVEGVAVDSEGNIYVAANNSSILVFSPGSTGNVAPIRTISGLATTINEPGYLTVDGGGNIYLLNGTNILKFAPDATGNVAPIATISSVALLLINNGIAVH